MNARLLAIAGFFCIALQATPDRAASQPAAPASPSASASLPDAAPAAPAAPAVSAEPPAAAETAAPAVVFRSTLANGMRVIVLPDHLAPVATTLVTYAVGSDDDTEPGVAHATEHMLFRGTPAVSAGQFADIAARMGARYNALTTDEYTLYFFQTPSAYVGAVLHLEADRMTNAAIRDADWRTERGPIEQEVRGQLSQPGRAIGEKLRQTFFRDTPFANVPVGTVAGFERMSAATIRAFYHTWYQPGNATLVVAGDVDPKTTLAQVEREFASIPNRAVPERKPIDVPPLAGATIRDSMDFPLGFAAVAFRMPGAGTPDDATARVLEETLKGGRGALAELSATGKTLAVLSFANAFPEVGACFVAALPARGETPDSASALVQGVLDGYRTNGIPAELIATAKARLLSEQAFREASISGLGSAWAIANAERRPSPDADAAAIANVTPEDVQRVLATYAAPERRLSLIISAKPTSATAKVDANAGSEDVSFTPSVNEPLPGWARDALRVALRPPANAGGAVHQLPNGLRFSTRPENASPTVVVSGVIRTDHALYEPAGKTGIHLIVDSLLGWGTTTLDRTAYQTQLDDITATETLGTSFTLNVQAKDFERGMALLADAMIHPAFAKSAFDVVEPDIAQGVGVQDKLPKERAARATRDALYPPGDPRRREASATSMAAVTLADVRAYYATAYRPDETTIAVVGDVTPARVESAMKASFGDWKANGRRPTFRYPAVVAAHERRAQNVTISAPANEQSEVTLKETLRLERSDPDYVPLVLANTMLSGEGTGSLLFAELRTRHSYVYDVSSDLDVQRNGAEFSVSFASDPKNVGRATSTVLGIIGRLQRTVVAETDVQRAKALLIAQRVLPLDSYDGVATNMLSGAKEGYDGGDEAFWNALVRTTPSDLRRAMKRIDAKHFVRVVVAP